MLLCDRNVAAKGSQLTMKRGLLRRQSIDRMSVSPNHLLEMVHPIPERLLESVLRCEL
jgi:hypothetical protein